MRSACCQHAPLSARKNPDWLLLIYSLFMLRGSTAGAAMNLNPNLSKFSGHELICPCLWISLRGSMAGVAMNIIAFQSIQRKNFSKWAKLRNLEFPHFSQVCHPESEFGTKILHLCPIFPCSPFLRQVWLGRAYYMSWLFGRLRERVIVPFAVAAFQGRCNQVTDGCRCNRRLHLAAARTGSRTKLAIRPKCLFLKE